jgi:hypothetical protein
MEIMESVMCKSLFTVLKTLGAQGIPGARKRPLQSIPIGKRPSSGALQRKAHRICISKSEDLERKARFFAKQKMRTLSFGTSSIDKLTLLSINILYNLLIFMGDFLEA